MAEPDKQYSTPSDGAGDMPIAATDEVNGAAGARRQKASKVVNWLLVALIVVLFASLVLRIFVVTTIVIDGDSMLSTFTDGQHVFVSKLARPERGDVVIFYKNEVGNKFWDMFSSDSADSDKYTKLIKRVVAVAGDKLWCERTQQGYVLVVETPQGVLHEDYYERRGKKLPQDSFVMSGSDLGRLSGRTSADPYVVSDGCIFVMGDNRNPGKSYDSRSFGEVDLSHLYGVVL